MDTSKDAILTWCREYIADLLGTTAEALDPKADFDKLGVDSALAVSLLMEVEDRYDIELPPEALFENPTLDAVADYLHQRTAQRVA